MAQNGTFSCTGDAVIDETGAETLLVAIVRQAAKDLRRRSTSEAKRRDAASFLEYLGVSADKLQEVARMAEDSTAPAPAPEAEYQVTEDDLVQLGLDPRKHRMTEAQRARRERTQRLQETAQALGLTPTRYTVDELERMFGGDENG